MEHILVGNKIPQLEVTKFRDVDKHKVNVYSRSHSTFHRPLWIELLRLYNEGKLKNTVGLRIVWDEERPFLRSFKMGDVDSRESLKDLYKKSIILWCLEMKDYVLLGQVKRNFQTKEEINVLGIDWYTLYVKQA